MATLQLRTSSNLDRHARLLGKWQVSLTSENTRLAYRRDLEALFSFLDGGSLDALDAERAHLDLWRTTQTGAPSTVARRLSAASSFYSYAASVGAVASNPVEHVKRPKVDPDYTATRGLSLSEAQALVSAAEQDSPRSLALVALLLNTGLRVSEALNAKRSDMTHDAGHRVLIVTHKGGAVAKVVLNADAVHALRAYLGTSAAEGTEVVAAHNTDELIFTTSKGKPWAASEAFRCVQRLARRAGIDGKLSPHSLRHTHITDALEKLPLQDVQVSAGHKDPRTTQRYNHSKGKLEKSSAYAVQGLYAAS